MLKYAYFVLAILNLIGAIATFTGITTPDAISQGFSQLTIFFAFLALGAYHE